MRRSRLIYGLLAAVVAGYGLILCVRAGITLLTLIGART